MTAIIYPLKAYGVFNMKYLQDSIACLLYVVKSSKDWIAKQNLRKAVAILALLLLALSASYGVYTFQLLFVPEWVALVSASAFEATYIGLAIAELTQASKKRAMIISLAAVAVSIIYNSLSALLHLSPNNIETLAFAFALSKQTVAIAKIVANLMLALLHGAPLALVAYFVADLVIHSPNMQAKQTVAAKQKQESKANSISLPVAKQSRPKQTKADQSKAESKANIAEANDESKATCSICGYEAKSKKALNGHMLKHRS